MGTLALIGLGSNLGDRKAYLDAAVAALAGTPGIEIRAVSSYHETTPVGGPGGQGAFLNAAARLDTTLDPHSLLRVLHEVEGREGRIRTVRWGERTLDLDLLIFGCKFLDTPELILPHPRMGVRRFVLAPLAEIAPDIVETTSGLSIKELLFNLDRRPSYLAIVGDDGALKDSVYRKLVERLDGIGIRGDDLALDPGQAQDRIESYFKNLEARARRLQPEWWPRGKGSERWLVSDYCLDFDLGRVGADVARFARQEGVEWIGRYSKDGIEGIRKISLGIFKPTFVVILGGPESLRRKPRFNQWPMDCKCPILWPQRDDPDSIVLDILAACAATRSG